MQRFSSRSIDDLASHSWIVRAYDLLESCFGDLHWWPGESPLEIVIGAILTQNTAWINVEKAIGNLKGAGLLSIEALYHITEENLSLVIKPAGFYRQKAKRLKAFIDFLVLNYGGNLSSMFEEDEGTLREKLLCVYGIGKETADSILLYAGGKLFFVIDAYTRRILGRHGVMQERASYEEYQKLFKTHLPKEVRIYNQYHALLVETGKRYCRREPLCANCPLKDI